MLTYKLYSFLSILVFGGSVINSYSIHEQYYPTLIDQVSSRNNKLIIINFLFFVLLSLNMKLISFIFGDIKESDRINLIEKLKNKSIELALLFVFFQEETLDMSFFIFIVGLLGLNMNQWLCVRRSEFMIADNKQNLRDYLKLIFFFLLQYAIDFTILKSLFDIGHNDKEKHILNTLFAIEIVMKMLKLTLPFIKFLVNTFELFTLSHFESKSTIFQVLYFLSTVSQILIQFYSLNHIRHHFGLPLHLIADQIKNILKLWQTIKNFTSSIKLIHQLQQLPDVTDNDLQNIDRTCLICLDEMKEGKKIGCGHIFHSGCLKKWLQGSVNQFCPKCKVPISFDQVQQVHQRRDPQPEIVHIMNQIGYQLVEQIKQEDEVKQNQQINVDKKLLKQQSYKPQVRNDQHQKDEIKKILPLKFGLPKEAIYERDFSHDFLKKKFNIQNASFFRDKKQVEKYNILRLVDVQKFNHSELNNIYNQSTDLDDEMKDIILPELDQAQIRRESWNKRYNESSDQQEQIIN